jgi:F-type H+-transporting ATPase subunit delta
MALQGPSRESYASALERLDAYAAGADVQRLTAIGDEILAVAELLRSQPRLRRAFVDPGRATEDRVALLEAVFAGKVDGDTLDLLRALVRGRWSTAAELLEGTERLGAEALLAAGERAGELSEVEDELFRFGRLAAGDPRLGGVLGDSTVDVGRRSRLVHDLLDGKARPLTVRLVELALAGFGGRGFAAALTRLIEMAALRRDREVAYVTAAVALSEDEERRLAERLVELRGRQVSVQVDVDPSVLGGLRVRVGDELYDGTIIRRLDQARKALTR